MSSHDSYSKIVNLLYDMTNRCLIHIKSITVFLEFCENIFIIASVIFGSALAILSPNKTFNMFKSMIYTSLFKSILISMHKSHIHFYFLLRKNCSVIALKLFSYYLITLIRDSMQGFRELLKASLLQ